MSKREAYKTVLDDMVTIALFGGSCETKEDVELMPGIIVAMGYIASEAYDVDFGNEIMDIIADNVSKTKERFVNGI